MQKVQTARRGNQVLPSIIQSSLFHDDRYPANGSLTSRLVQLTQSVILVHQDRILMVPREP